MGLDVAASCVAKDKREILTETMLALVDALPHEVSQLVYIVAWSRGLG